MIKLFRHIEELLLENDCVIVPGLGGFVAHYAPATYIKEENRFLPPTRTIGFNPQLKLNDGMLVQSYMAAYNIGFADASHKVETEVKAFAAQLHEDGKARLDNIGELHYNIYGNYEFAPYDHKMTTPSLYGLDAFEMRELTSLQRTETPTASDAEKKTYSISINRSLIHNVAAVAAVILLLFVFATPVGNTYIKNVNYARLLPSELMSYAQATVKDTIPQDHAVINPQMSTPRPIISNLKIESDEEQPVVAQPQPKPYHLIVASGIGLKNAKAMVDRLKEKGFPDAQVLRSKGKTRVSIRAFDDRHEATRQMLELRKNETYPDVWLLVN